MKKLENISKFWKI